jgi:hypothetical protein
MFTRRAIATLAGLSLAACGDGGGGSSGARSATPDVAPTTDARPAADVGASDARTADQGAPTPDARAPDAGSPDLGTPDAAPGPVPGEVPVEVDLAPYLTPLPGAAGRASVRVAAGPDDLLTGPSAQGRAGDWVLENERVRFVIERAARVIGPCPWGGNVIDSAARRPDGTFTEDVLGEGCLFLSVGQTFAPDRFEVVADGADGGAAVLSATGRVEQLDFIHLQGMIAAFLSGAAVRIPWDSERLPPVTITQSWILRPGDQGVRVVTALRNDGATQYDSPVGFFIDSGGSVEFFNPSSSLRGFGYEDLSPSTLTGEPLTLLAFRGERGSHAYFPEPSAELSTDLPRAGFYVSIAGVAVSILDRTDLLSTIVPAPAQIPTLPGALHLAPGESARRVHWQYAGTGALSSMLDAGWRDAGVATGALHGTVTDAAGAPVVGARVSAVDAEGRTLNQAMSADDGTYALRTPPGTLTVRAFAGNRVGAAAPLAVGVDADVQADVQLPAAGTLHVQIRLPDGTPAPGKVMVMCEGPCRDQPASTERDVSFDGPIDGSAATVFTGPSGEAEIPVAAGQYRVSVTRGMAWSVWPPDAVTSGGRLLTVEGGQRVEVQAEIAKVVDTAGALSGDFHVHAVPSPDSPVSLEDRVRSFVGEGVDVIVSTDHDVITDYAPVIDALDFPGTLASVIGEELTTFDYGHFNGFPLTRDTSPNGGAYDWAGGSGPGKTPAEIFDFYDAFPGTQVIQVNHPDSGYFRALKLDALRGTSWGTPADFRMPPREPDPVTGDTGLFDEGFTAMEMLNGYSLGQFNGIMHWWLAMIGRGFTPTATAVSDTHKQLLSQAGGPRSYVFVDAAHDTPATFDAQHFAEQVNAGRLVGTTGPFMRVTARNLAGERAAIGDTLDAPPGEPVTVEVELDLPEWMRLDTLFYYANVGDEVDVGHGAVVEDPVTPTGTRPISLGEADLVEVAAGTERHRHYRKTLSFEYTPEAGADAYLVVVVRQVGEGGGMFPVVHRRSARPMAFANPVYLDTDGGGYDHPPLAELARLPREARRTTAVAPRPLNVDDVKMLLRATAHDH